MSAVDPAALGLCAAEIAFVGRSNVGKSSLLNALCRQDIARVSGRPGSTRTLNVYLIGKDRRLVDLPGYGYARGAQREREGWSKMIEGYLTGRGTLKMVFVLVDAEIGASKLDIRLSGWLKANDLPHRFVATKSDRVRSTKAAAQKTAVAAALAVKPEELAWVSAKEGTGVRELRAEASALLGLS